MYWYNFFFILLVVLLLWKFKWYNVYCFKCEVYCFFGFYFYVCLLDVVDCFIEDGYCFFRDVGVVINNFFVDCLFYVYGNNCMCFVFIFIYLYCF